MALTSGEKLGSYEILSAIGAGGMGQVYRARDTRLGRDVAIKVLPEEFTQHPDKLARFEREARLLAALNHPRIATIHEVEEWEGKPFIVMELAEGETLAERIARGPIPAQEALPLALQIAEALEAAHERGVVHRDLKPANIQLDAEGKLKVLDFGLAKAFTDESPESELSQSPTLSRDATRTGVILGTAAYMSPEQAKGKSVDKRADVFSFGAVLYEMLSGKKAFGGDDVSDVLARILAVEPDWKALPSDLDPRIHKLLRRCLRRDRNKRLRDIGDARNEIEDILGGPADPGVSSPVSPADRIARHAPSALVGVVIGALLAGIALWNGSPPPQSRTPLRFGITLPSTQGLTGGGSRVVAFSPDGSRLVYTANRQLYLREMDQMETAPLRGTAINPRGPFFSPDGQWIGVLAADESTLKKVSIRGGTPITLCEAQGLLGASWGRDDSIVFAEETGRVLRVSANGGAPEILVEVDATKGEAAYGPEILPDGETLLFTLRTGGSWEEARIVAQSLESGERRVLIEVGADARYVPTGHLVYALGETVLAVPFDLERLEVSGGAVPVLEGIQRSPPTIDAPSAQFSFSASGSLVFLPKTETAQALLFVDRDGREETLPVPPGDYSFPRLSPDGERLAVIAAGDVWIYSVARGTSTRLTFTEDNNYLAWTPDGNRVIFSSTRSGPSHMFWKSADGRDEAVQLTTGELDQHVDSVSPDGRMVSFHTHAGGNTGLWILPLDGEREPQPFLQTPFNERASTFSPDGRWLAYVSDESGRTEVYVQPVDGPGGKYQISTEGGRSPLWNRSGQELFYRSAKEEMMVVNIAAERGLSAGAPSPLFEKRRDRAGPLTHYDVTPDGKRFVMRLPDQERAVQLHVVLDWYEELKRLVPVE